MKHLRHLPFAIFLLCSVASAAELHADATFSGTTAISGTLTLPGGTSITNTTGTGNIVLSNSPAITTPTGIVKGDVGLGNVDNTSDATKNAAAVTLTNKTINLDANSLLFTNSGAGAAATAMDERMKLGDVMPQDFGAIADGASHPVSQWLAGGRFDRGFANLAAIQLVYPMVGALTDEIDWAATKAAIATRRNVFMPNGQYIMSGELCFERFGQEIRGQNWLFTQLYFPAASNGFRLKTITEGDVLVSGSIEVGPNIGTRLRNLRFIGAGVGVATGDGISGDLSDNPNAWSGDLCDVDMVMVQGFERGIYTGGMANIRWGHLTTTYNDYGFVVGTATQNGVYVQHLMPGPNRTRNIVVNTGANVMFNLGDCGAGSSDSSANGMISIEVMNSATATFHGTNAEYGNDTGLRGIYVHGGATAIIDGFSFHAGANSKAISPIYVENLGHLRYAKCSMGGFNAGVTGIEGDTGADVTGDASMVMRIGGTNGTLTGAATVSATDGEIVTPSAMQTVRDDAVAPPDASLRGQFFFVYGRNGFASDAVYGYGLKIDGTPYKFNLDATSLLSASNTYTGGNTFTGNNHFSGNTTIDFPVFGNGLQVSGTLGSGRTQDWYSGATLIAYMHPGGEFGPQSLHVGGAGGNGNAQIDGTATLNGLLHLTPRAAPGSPNEGDIYVDSSTHHLNCYLGGAWHQLDN